MAAVAWLAAAGLFVYAVRAYLRQRAFVGRSRPATATVVGFVERAGRGGLLRFPLLRFTTLDGAEVTAENPVGARPTPYREGQAVPVLYDPAAPTSASIASGWTLHLESIVAGCMGLVALVLGLMFALFFLLERAISTPVGTP
jgi:hypothetical protein